MSAPAANTSSEPAMTMQRISGSASWPSSRPASSSITSGLSALRASGRLRRQRATWPSTEPSTKAKRLLLHHRGHRVDPGRGPPDDQLLDLRGPFVKRGDAGVTQVALHRVVVDVAGAAVHLDRHVGAVD